MARDHPLLQRSGKRGEGVVGEAEVAQTFPGQRHVERAHVLRGTLCCRELTDDLCEPRPGDGRWAKPAQEVPGDGQVAVAPGHEALHVLQLESRRNRGKGFHRRRNHAAVWAGSRSAKRSLRMALLLSMTVIDADG